METTTTRWWFHPPNGGHKSHPLKTSRIKNPQVKGSLGILPSRSSKFPTLDIQTPLAWEGIWTPKTSLKHQTSGAMTGCLGLHQKWHKWMESSIEFGIATPIPYSHSIPLTVQKSQTTTWDV